MELEARVDAAVTANEFLVTFRECDACSRYGDGVADTVITT